jgi:hypothetical protein
VPPLEVGALFKPGPDGAIGGRGWLLKDHCRQSPLLNLNMRTSDCVLPSLNRPAQHAPHIHPHPRTTDAKAELLRLNRALLVLFLELLSVLVEQPGGYAESVTKVIGALQNMQHLVNLQRPVQVRLGLVFGVLVGLLFDRRSVHAGCAAHPSHPPNTPNHPAQARHTLEFMLQQQIAKKREALGALRRQAADARERLAAAAAALAAAGGDGAESKVGGGGAAAAAMDTS